MLFSKEIPLPEVNRNFTPPYFINHEYQTYFEHYGYVVLKDIVTNEELLEATGVFQELRKMDSYKVGRNFESAGNFTCKSTQRFIFEFIEQFIAKIAPRFANLANCELGEGGTFFIKPPTKESILHPHQDSTVIDESNSYGIFVWIPLTNITTNNGPLYVLPGSHLWGNFYRSQHIPWAFRNEYKYLWTKMIPITVNTGDIICFDTSIIHGSGTNMSDTYRIATCGALLPKNHQKVDFLYEQHTLYKYAIDNDYWLDGGQAASLSRYPKSPIDYSYPNPINRKKIDQLLKKYV